MAAGVVLEPGGGMDTQHYPGKMTLYVIFTCLVASSGGLIFGYDIGISGGVTSMDTFLRNFFHNVYVKEQEQVTADQYCMFDSQTLTLFTSSLYLAALIASFFASKVTRSFGRKVSMLAGSAVFLAGAAINGFAENVSMLIIGRIFLGVGVGFANQSVPLYLAEMAPAKMRGMLSVIFQLMITIGVLVANLINFGMAMIPGGWGWRVSLGLAAVPAIIMLAGSLILPETPNSLVQRGQHEKAKTILRKIRGTDDIYAEHTDLVAASEESKAVVDPWSTLLQRKYRPHFFMSFSIPTLQQLTGVSVVMCYSPLLFKTIGFGASASLMSAVIIGVVNMCATLTSVAVVDKFGRRFLLLQGGVQMFISQVIIGILIALKFGTTGQAADLSKGYAVLIVFFICVFVSGFAWSWGPLGWLLPSEIFPLEVRSAAQSINVSVNMFFTFVLAEVALPMFCRLKFCIFFFFAFWLVVMTVFVLFLLPETKGVPIEEMTHIWKQHWFWRRFYPEDNYGVAKVEMC